MTMFFGIKGVPRTGYFRLRRMPSQTIDVVRTRAKPLGMSWKRGRQPIRVSEKVSAPGAVSENCIADVPRFHDDPERFRPGADDVDRLGWHRRRRKKYPVRGTPLDAEEHPSSPRRRPSVSSRSDAFAIFESCQVDTIV